MSDDDESVQFHAMEESEVESIQFREVVDTEDDESVQFNEVETDSMNNPSFRNPPGQWYFNRNRSSSTRSLTPKESPPGTGGAVAAAEKVTSPSSLGDSGAMSHSQNLKAANAAAAQHHPSSPPQPQRDPSPQPTNQQQQGTIVNPGTGPGSPTIVVTQSTDSSNFNTAAEKQQSTVTVGSTGNVADGEGSAGTPTSGGQITPPVEKTESPTKKEPQQNKPPKKTVIGKHFGTTGRVGAAAASRRSGSSGSTGKGRFVKANMGANARPSASITTAQSSEGELSSTATNNTTAHTRPAAATTGATIIGNGTTANTSAAMDVVAHHRRVSSMTNTYNGPPSLMNTGSFLDGQTPGLAASATNDDDPPTVNTITDVPTHQSENQTVHSTPNAARPSTAMLTTAATAATSVRSSYAFPAAEGSAAISPNSESTAAAANGGAPPDQFDEMIAAQLEAAKKEKLAARKTRTAMEKEMAVMDDRLREASARAGPNRSGAVGASGGKAGAGPTVGGGATSLLKSNTIPLREVNKRYAVAGTTEIAAPSHPLPTTRSGARHEACVSPKRRADGSAPGAEEAANVGLEGVVPVGTAQPKGKVARRPSQVAPRVDREGFGQGRGAAGTFRGVESSNRSPSRTARAPLQLDDVVFKVAKEQSVSIPESLFRRGGGASPMSEEVLASTKEWYYLNGVRLSSAKAKAFVDQCLKKFKEGSLSNNDKDGARRNNGLAAGPRNRLDITGLSENSGTSKASQGSFRPKTITTVLRSVFTLLDLQNLGYIVIEELDNILDAYAEREEPTLLHHFARDVVVPCLLAADAFNEVDFPTMSQLVLRTMKGGVAVPLNGGGVGDHQFYRLAYPTLPEEQELCRQEGLNATSELTAVEYATLVGRSRINLTKII